MTSISPPPPGANMPPDFIAYLSQRLPNRCCQEGETCPYDCADAQTVADLVREYIANLPGQAIAFAWFDPQLEIGRARPGEAQAEWRVRSVKHALAQALGGAA